MRWISILFAGCASHTSVMAVQPSPVVASCPAIAASRERPHDGVAELEYHLGLRDSTDEYDSYLRAQMHGMAIQLRAFCEELPSACAPPSPAPPVTPP
jgi:hypothetical protein